MKKEPTKSTSFLDRTEDLVGILLPIKFGSIDHVGQRSFGLGPLTRLQAAVGIDPELIGLEIPELRH